MENKYLLNLIITFRQLQNNRIAVIEANAFRDVSIGSLQLQSNLLKTIEPYGFNATAASTMYVSKMDKAISIILYFWA